MFKNILIATDGSTLAGHAVTNGLSLAKAIGAKVYMIHVDAPMHAERIKTEGREALNQAARQASAAGIQCDTIFVEHNQPHQAILAAAKEKDCDLLVMASHGRGGLTEALLGSVAHGVLRHTHIPVLVCR